MKAKEVKANDVIVERTDRGRIIDQFRVNKVTRCASDPSNVHFLGRSEGKANYRGLKTWCYFEGTDVEV